VLGIFKIRFQKLLALFAWGWLQTKILLISSSRLARITGIRHQCPAAINFQRLMRIFFGGVGRGDETGV
jgi:hypothetical protein